MSKGRDFRGPRKRGFDDDAPSPFDAPRQFRPQRQAFDRPPLGGGFGGEFSPPPSAAAGNTIDAVVKWFKTDKGFGFVELANGTGDAFLHIGALQSAGFESVPPGAKLKVLVANGVKGQQVTRVVEVDTAGAAERAPQRSFDSPRPAPAGRRAPDLSSAVEIQGAVKWFDGTKGFGFVQANDGGKDVFVHISILGPAGISALAEGQPVSMKVVDTQKGREAVSISLA